MRNCCFCILAFLAFLPLHAQVERASWKGKDYYVYPYQDEAMESGQFDLFSMVAEEKEVLERDDKNRKVIGVKVITIDKKNQMDFFPKERKFKKTREFIVLAMQKHPELFYTYENTIDREITPTTEVLPDGEYIQYYRDLPYLDGKTLRYRNDVVAAVFSIRNGQLNGPAQWLSAEGKIIKNGSYVNGSRDSNWSVFTYEARQPEEGEEIPEPKQYTIELLEESLAKQKYDTITEHWAFSNGLLNGAYSKTFGSVVLESGSYKNDQPSGEWIIKEYRYDVDFEKNKYERSKEPVLRKHFTYADPKKVGKSVIVRDMIVPEDYWFQDDTTEFSFRGMEMDFEPFSNFYELYDGEEENLELPDESFTSYEGEENEEGYYDYEHYYDGPMMHSPSHNDLIDSLGYRFNYEGVYEEYYLNGQLKMRFEVKDGVLVKEDTVFWDNGQAVNVVNFLPDSNKYEQLFYDYNGKLYLRMVYDEKGNQPEDWEEEDYYGLGYETVLIRNREYSSQNSGDRYYYDTTLVLSDSVTGIQLLDEGLWKQDSTQAFQQTYDPLSRTLQRIEYTISGKPISTTRVQFSEDFSNLAGELSFAVENLRYQQQINGAYIPDNPYMGGAADSLTTERITSWWRHYENEWDGVLYLNDQPFTGTYSLKQDTRKYKLKTKANSIAFAIPDNPYKSMQKAIHKYYKSNKQVPLLDYSFSESYNPFMDAAEQLTPRLGFLINYYPASDYYEFEGEGVNKKEPLDRALTGSYLNGKPEGLWKTVDQFGDATMEATFLKGELDGAVTRYSTAFPLTKQELKRITMYEDEYGDDYLPRLKAERPEKKTRYVSSVSSFKSGIPNGPWVQYDWRGDTTSYEYYKDGSLEGFGFQRNAYVYSARNYENGMLDGLAQTWLTLPNRDSILLYDLSFQNGLLQGESKAYHTNGKLAKHGFFLTGQPIDDYEAYDTLGFRYQYVKFQYNQPIEEKIWEANQLSVRYEFDWRDSIPFETWDISESTSLDALLVEYDWSDGSEMQPYYGRPSLVDKAGIDYRMTKYYPNDSIAREGTISKGKKVGCWNYYSYEGKFLYEADYADTIIVVNDSIKFKSKGVLTYVDEKGDPLSHSYIIEKFEKYDCSHTDHYEERMLYAFWEKDTSVHRINGYVKNYYENGALQNEGYVKDGLPTGVWKLYDNAGNLSHVGEYVMGKRHGRWLSGDLGEVKYLGDICLNPNLPNLEEIMAYQEKLLDITVKYYQLGAVLKTDYFGINMNPNDPPENYYGEGYYGDGEMYFEGE